MISHSECDHPKTPSARAKCRRLRSRDGGAGGEGAVREKGGSRATPKSEWGGKAHHDPDRERNTGQVPRDRHLQCDICGVERIMVKGTDPLTGILIYVGERCSYMVERQPDFEVLP
jgi:hypothetical protein